MPYYGEGAPHYYSAPFANHSSLMTGSGRSYHNPIAARYSPHLSTISESPLSALRRYSPAASATKSSISSIVRPRRIIDTADIDVSKPPRTLTQENRQQRHRLRRDRPTIKIRSQALKDNPALREYNEKHEKTVGELLVEKFLIKDKQLQDGLAQPKTKLYHQASLMPRSPASKSDEVASEDECEDDILSAIRRRVTRRMTRRRSSADILPLDPQQLEREAALHAAQAVALDSLVAAEQAELEVEARRGTFMKRPVMRLPSEISEESEGGEEEDEDEDEDEAGDETIMELLSKRGAATKRKKKRRGPEDDGLAAEEEAAEDAEHLKAGAEEFEWDEREKCNDIGLIAPAVNETVASEEKALGPAEKAEEEEDDGGAKLKSDARAGLQATSARKRGVRKERPDDESRVDVVSIKEPQVRSAEAIEGADGVGEEREAVEEVGVRGGRGMERKRDSLRLERVDLSRRVASRREERVSCEASERNGTMEDNDTGGDISRVESSKGHEESKVVELKGRRDIKRAVSVPQEQVDKDEAVLPTYKIEARNSVGHLSTLFVKSSNYSPVSAQTIEQFRESIRLPAPRKFGAMEMSKIETRVVLPVRRAYIRDTSRNSVYLALQPGQNARQKSGVGATGDSSSTIIEETRKESGSEGAASIDRGPAKSLVTDHRHNQSKIVGESVISGVAAASRIGETVARSPSVISDDFNGTGKLGGEALAQQPVDAKTKISTRIDTREEFVSWWDEVEDAPDAEFEVKSVVGLDDVGGGKGGRDREVDNERELGEFGASDKVGIRSKCLGRGAIDKTDKVRKPVSDKESAIKDKAKQSSAAKKEQLLPKGGTSSSGSKRSSTIEISGSREESITSLEFTNDLTTHNKKLASNGTLIIKHESLKVEERLPNIPEEPKSGSPSAEQREPEPFRITAEARPSSLTNCDKFSDKKEKPSFSVARLKKADPQLARARSVKPEEEAVPRGEKDERKKKVNAEAIVKIEKKILQEADSPRKILTTAIPETQLIEVASVVTLSPGKENELESTWREEKVGLLPTTKKKSSEGAAAHAPEIDFWSEIKAQESVKVPGGTRRKAQLRVDSPTEEGGERLAAKSRASIRVESPKNLQLEEDRVEGRAPLMPEDEDLALDEVHGTPAPSSESVKSRSERRNRAALIDCQPADDNRPSALSSDPTGTVPPTSQERLITEESLADAQDRGAPGTIKKLSKWTKQDNLSSLSETSVKCAQVAAKEAGGQVSIESSTTTTTTTTTTSTTKKKVTKRKKTSTVGKKKADKTESTKTSTKTKVTIKKVVAAAPQTTQLKTPMSITGSPRNTPSQRPADLKKLFYNTPAILLTATPRDLRKVRRAKAKKKNPTTRALSLSSDSTGSTRSTATTSTEESSNCDEDAEQRRLASTRSNDSGFDGSPRLSTPSQSSDNQRNAEAEHYQHSGRITPPATNLPRFKKYEVTDFNFLKVLGKGSFGKVLLAELRGTECVYAVKCLKKDVVLEDDDVECTLIERKVLTLATRHPYLCHLFCTFQTESHLFFVMEYLNGGDLMFHIQKSGRFSEPRAKFYAAEIWSGLIFLHKKGIVYRDLKLDNVLLDFEGHIRIADFGMCKLQIFLDRTADTFCGTPDYMAPEIIKGLKYNQAVDWWSFGVLLYEMLTGQSPFSGCDEDELFWSICNERPFIPRYLSQSSTDILVCLLEKDAGKRIPGHEIACHSFFCTIAWDKLERRALEAPFKPAVEHTLDTRYFDTAFTAERPRLTPVPGEILTSMDQAVFRGFSYTNPNATD